MTQQVPWQCMAGKEGWRQAHSSNRRLEELMIPSLAIGLVDSGAAVHGAGSP